MIISFANLNGGAGKTTTAITVACVLADRGASVLVIDADPQGSAVLWAETATTLPFAAVSVALRSGGPPSPRPR